MPGEVVLAEVRSLPAYQATPVVIFSALARDIAEPLCRRFGATAYVPKASDGAAHTASVKEVVRRWLTADRAY